MKTLKDALSYFSQPIWSDGESDEGCLCIVPETFDGSEFSDYNRASQIVFYELKATHFDRTWQKKGKSVKLRFYQGNSFGACLKVKLLCEKIVNV